MIRHESHFYCSEHWQKLVDGLAERVDAISENARYLYIGRSHYPEQRLLEHREKDRTRMAVLHWASCKPETAALESALIDACGHLFKMQNARPTSRGRWASHWNCIYVTWTPRDRAVREGRFSDVARLDRGNCIAPTRNFLGPVSYLETNLSKAAAKDLLAKYDDYCERMKYWRED